MRCARVEERLVLFLAGELRPDERARLIGHLERCAACTAMVEGLATTQERVATALQMDIAPPATLDARVMAAIRALPQPGSTPAVAFAGRRRQPRFALAAAACLVICSGVLWLRTPAAPALASLEATHRRLIATSPFPTTYEVDPQRLAQQLTSQARFRVRAADLKSEGATLEGGIQTTVDNVPMVALRYAWQGKQVSIFEMDAGKATPAALRQLGHEADSYYVHKTGDLACVAWHSGKTDCVMIARAIPMHQLFHLACRACERQEQSSDADG
jgi:anti-sigma factor RsiW